MSDELALRVSDAEREQAVATLRDAAAEGRLTLEEFSERAGAAYASRTRGELERVTHDLPARTVRSRKRPKRLTLSVFGGATRKGRWRAPRRSLLLTVFGGSDLDLRQAELDAPVVTIVALTLFGGADVYVPEGVEVDLRGLPLFGGHDEHGMEGRLSPAAPLVRVVAFLALRRPRRLARPARRDGAAPRAPQGGAQARAGPLESERWKAAASAFPSAATPRT